MGQNGLVTDRSDTPASHNSGPEVTVAPDSSYYCGRWEGRGPRLAVVNPADGSTAASVATVTPTEVAEALDAASIALQSWRHTDPWARSQHLRDAATYIRDHLGAIAASVTTEQGKPLAQAEGEVAGAADQFDWCADEARRIYGRVIPARGAGRRLLVQREPVGVVGAFAPSNFPALLPARKIAAATAAGCTIIVKPAEETPTAALWLAAAAEAAGIPPGVVSVLVGDPARISEMILTDSRVRKVTLTGSVPLGGRIMEEASKQLKSVSLELGGHSPVIVLDDADPEWAGEASAKGKFRNAGQVCISPSRFLVPAALHDRFVASFVATTEALAMGPGDDRSCDIGPLQNERRLQAMEQLVASAVSDGAVVESGGKRIERDAGWWFEPTVLTNVGLDTEIMVSEPFGPVAPICSYDDVDEAVRIANDTDFGLAGFVLGGSLQRCLDVADRLEVGMVGINDFAIALAEAPFGGIKHSGFGREGGAEGVAEFTVVKYINVAPS